MKNFAKKLCAIILVMSMMITLLILPANAAGEIGYVAPTGSPAVTGTTYPTVSAYKEAAIATAAGTATAEQTEVMNSASYVVTSLEDWEAIRQLVDKVAVTSTSYTFEGKKVYLTQNLNAAGQSVKCIAPTFGTAFKGHLDGQGYTIDNVRMTCTDKYNNGLFGFTMNATFENLVIGSGCVFTQHSPGDRDWRASNASLVAIVWGTGTIRNVQSAASVLTNGSNAASGGIVGQIWTGNNVTISNCTFTGVASPDTDNAFTNTPRIGGIVGFIQASTGTTTISNCVNEGTVTSRTTGAWYTNGAGGIVGESQNTTLIQNCVNRGVITAPFAGGILGTQINGSGTVIKNCTHFVDHSAATSYTATGVLGAQGAPNQTTITPGNLVDTATGNNTYDSTLLMRGFQKTAPYYKGKSQVYNIRFFATGMDTDYQKVGFIVRATSHNKTWDKSTTVVYDALSATTSDGKTITAATAAGYQSNYIYAITVNGIPADTDVTFHVQPYAVTEKDVTIYGQPHTATVNVSSDSNLTAPDLVENFHIELGDPMLVVKGTEADSKDSNYRFPYMRYTVGGQSIVINWKMSPDSVNSYDGAIGTLVSDDGGKTWRKRIPPRNRTAEG